jgi:hypothetical protein
LLLKYKASGMGFYYFCYKNDGLILSSLFCKKKNNLLLNTWRFIIEWGIGEMKRKQPLSWLDLRSGRAEAFKSIPFLILFSKIVNKYIMRLASAFSNSPYDDCRVVCFCVFNEKILFQIYARINSTICVFLVIVVV